MDVIKDTEEFCRKRRLREFFQNSENSDESLVRNKSNFKPNSNRDKQLEDYINCFKTAAQINQTDIRVRDNITILERKALENIRSDNTIIIKEADKGGAIVIMDKDHYKEMVLEQLNDIHFYQELPSNQDSKTMSRIKKYVTKFTKNLTDKEEDFLLNFEVKTSNFYGLPKIHKSKQIQTGKHNLCEPYIKLPRPTDLKLRPIVAGSSCPTQRLSNFLDIILKPLCKLIPSYIRDDMDFLKSYTKYRQR